MSIVQHTSSSLAIEADQHQFTPMQVSALAQIGVDQASEGDLAVFFHVCKRSGLDPFARQIHMIGRQTSERTPSGEWIKVTKQTIQTGIDGFRLIGRRAADRAKHGVSVKAPEWAHTDGSWRPVWIASAWGFPIAARVTIERGGEPFTAVALFDEYKQTKGNGDLTSMWARRPAGQLAKCAEALAWRMAFPQDLSGIYADEEMEQADGAQWDGGNGPPRQAQPGASGAERMSTILGTVEETTAGPDSGPLPDLPPDAYPEGAEPLAPPESPPLNTSSRLARAMYAAIKAHGIPEVERIVWLGNVIGREIDSSKDMTEQEARNVLSFLEQWDAEQAAKKAAEEAGQP